MNDVVHTYQGLEIDIAIHVILNNLDDLIAFGDAAASRSIPNGAQPDP